LGVEKMLNYRHFVGFSSGVALGCIYGWFGPSGCGTVLGTTPILLAWLVVAKLFGSFLADRHTWLAIALAALAQGLLLGFLCWLLDIVVRKFVSDRTVVRLALLPVLVTIYASFLFFVWPLQDCP
jgi:hypothetical protein